MITEILLHKIEYWWDDAMAEASKREIDRYDIEHIKEAIELGNREGELNQTYTDYDKEGTAFDHEIRGWWKIIFNR